MDTYIIYIFSHELACQEAELRTLKYRARARRCLSCMSPSTVNVRSMCPRSSRLREMNVVAQLLLKSIPSFTRFSLQDSSLAPG